MALRKFIFVHLFNDRSGSPKVLSQVINAMSKTGRSVEVLTSSHVNGFLDNTPGLKRRIFYRRTENKLITLAFYMVSQAYLFFYCLRYCREDVVFYVNTMMPFGAALSAKIMGKPVIYHVHETSIRPRLLKVFLRFVIRITAGKVFFVSDYLKSVESFGQIPQHVIHNALVTPVSPVVRKLKDEFNVLMVCSLKKYKGVLEFLKVAERFLGERSLTFTLVLNASDGEIEEFFSGISASKNLKLISRQSDVGPFYEAASLVMSLSRPDEWVESFGLTIIEAMAKGLPVIVPPVGGPAELVVHGQQGYKISCYEIDEICRAINRLARDSDLYQMMSDNAVQHAKKFELDVFDKKIIEAVDQ